VEVYKKTKDFPREELYGLTSQMRRAAISVCANIAEGSGRGSLSDYCRFLFIAQGSLSELEYLLHIAHRLGYLSNAAYRHLASLQSEAAKLLRGFIKALLGSNKPCRPTQEVSQRRGKTSRGFCLLWFDQPRKAAPVSFSPFLKRRIKVFF